MLAPGRRPREVAQDPPFGPAALPARWWTGLPTDEFVCGSSSVEVVACLGANNMVDVLMLRTAEKVSSKKVPDPLSYQEFPHFLAL